MLNAGKNKGNRLNHTGFDTITWTRKKNDDESDHPRNNYGEKNCPPINYHLANPLYESTKEKEKTEFNGKERGVCQNEIRITRFMKSKQSR